MPSQAKRLNVLVIGARDEGLGGQIANDYQKQGANVLATGSQAGRIVGEDNVVDFKLTEDPRTNQAAIEKLIADVKTRMNGSIDVIIYGPAGAGKQVTPRDFRGEAIGGNPYFPAAEAITATGFEQVINATQGKCRVVGLSYKPEINGKPIPGFYPPGPAKKKLEEFSVANDQLVIQAPEFMTNSTNIFKGRELLIIYRFLKEILPFADQNEEWKKIADYLSTLPFYNEIISHICRLFEDDNLMQKMGSSSQGEIEKMVLEKSTGIPHGYLHFMASMISDFERKVFSQKAISAIGDDTKKRVINIGVGDLLDSGNSHGMEFKTPLEEKEPMGRDAFDFLLHIQDDEYQAPAPQHDIFKGHFGVVPGVILEDLLEQRSLEYPDKETTLDTAKEIWSIKYKDALYPLDRFSIEKGLPKKGGTVINIIKNGKIVVEIIKKVKPEIEGKEQVFQGFPEAKEHLENVQDSLPHKPPFLFATDRVGCVDAEKGNFTFFGEITAPSGIGEEVPFDRFKSYPFSIAMEAVMQTAAGAFISKIGKVNGEERKNILLRSLDFQQINPDITSREQLSFIIKTKHIKQGQNGSGATINSSFEIYNSKGKLVASGEIGAMNF